MRSLTEKNGEHLHGLRRMDRSENNAVAAGHLAIPPLISFTLKRLHESLKGVGFECNKVAENPPPPVGRDGFKLFCGFVLDVDDPVHGAVDRGAQTCPGASLVPPS